MVNGPPDLPEPQDDGSMLEDRVLDLADDPDEEPVLKPGLVLLETEDF